MQAVFLDYKTVDSGDLDLSPISDLLPELIVYENTKNEEIAERIKFAEIIIINKIDLDASLLSKAQNAKLICLVATGTNNVDLESAKSLGIAVCNIKNYCTDSVVQHVFLSILTLQHSLLDYQISLDQGAWQNSALFSLLNHPIAELRAKKLGIVGFGVLGSGVAKMAENFGMEVLIAESLDKNRVQKNDASPRINFNELVKESDFISLHCPLTDCTEKLFNQAVFAAMKNNAFLINTARGALIEDEDLILAIKNKEIAGAAIDVFDEEPPPLDHPLIRESFHNLIITPHIAWAAIEARQRALECIAENIDAFLKDKPINVVNA
jgi:glycerate dehydrogenase